jgi:hypothetical protein
MKKILKYIAKGTLLSALVSIGYLASLACFVEVFSENGFMAVLKFLLSTLGLTASGIVAGCIGYIEENALTIREKEGAEE